MAKYYKITPEWAEKLGQAKAAPRHPDGMRLVTVGLKNHLMAYLQEKEGLKLLPDEAFAYIGAIPLTIAEARLSEAGQLRHDGSAAESENAENEDSADNADNPENPENTED